jgi:hypothetical protein
MRAQAFAADDESITPLRPVSSQPGISEIWILPIFLDMPLSDR